jgi:hypothetical protein
LRGAGISETILEIKDLGLGISGTTWEINDLRQIVDRGQRIGDSGEYTLAPEIAVTPLQVLVINDLNRYMSRYRPSSQAVTIHDNGRFEASRTGGTNRATRYRHS